MGHGAVAVARFTRDFLLQPLWQGACWVASGSWHAGCFVVQEGWKALAALANGLHGFVLVPLYHGAVAVARFTRDFLLQPLWQGACWIASGSWRAGCFIALGAWHVSKAVATAMHNSAILPLYHGAIAVAQSAHRHLLLPIWNGTCWVCTHAWRLAVLSTEGIQAACAFIHASVLLPTGQLVRAAAYAIYEAVVKPIAHGIKTCARASASAVGDAAHALGG